MDAVGFAVGFLIVELNPGGFEDQDMSNGAGEGIHIPNLVFGLCVHAVAKEEVAGQPKDGPPAPLVPSEI